MVAAHAIETVDELISIIRSSDFKGGDDFWNSLEFPEKIFEPFYKWHHEHYARITLDRTETHELVLVCWDRFQESVIHDHDKAGCWVKVLEGMLTEKRFKIQNDQPVLISEKSLTKGASAYIDNTQGAHKMENPSFNRAVSLHYYTPPISQYNMYQEEGWIGLKTI